MKSGITMLIDGAAGPVSEQQGHFLGIIKKNLDRLHRLVNDVLDYTKLQSGRVEFKIKEHDLNESVREVAEQERKVAEQKKLDFQVALDPRVGKVSFDPDKITQVLQNLLDNAVKFTPIGGVTVSTALDPGGKAAVVRVKDTGVGIPEDGIGKLFQEFQQVGGDGSHAKPEGTGLGLAICREIIEGHGGRIWAESRFGEGSEFVFTLPVSRAS
jgi:signal transduction histidine kinase